MWSFSQHLPLIIRGSSRKVMAASGGLSMALAADSHCDQNNFLCAPEIAVEDL